MERYQTPGVEISADSIEIGNNVSFGKDININVRGKLVIGDNSIIKDRFTADAEELVLGENFFYLPTDSRGMTIGGGGAGFPFACLHIGDNVVCHTGHINLAREVTIGDDVGLSHDVDLITHGFWGSVLDGYPRQVKGITIGNNVIVGWKSIIMPGVVLGDDIVIGANSTVTKSLLDKGIYAGSPAKFVKGIYPPNQPERDRLIDNIMLDFSQLLEYYEWKTVNLYREDNLVHINKLTIDIDNKTCEGEHDVMSDAFRDFLRRYGIRVHAAHGFKFELTRL